MKKFLLYYFLFLIFFLSLLCSGVMDSQDGFAYLAVARNIYYTGKPTMQPYEYPSRKNIHMSTYIGKDGNSYSTTGLGYSLALIPAVAITDLFYKIYHVQPAVYFPLENDWLILLFASLTNIFFASGLAVILYLYFRELALSKKQAFFMSLISIFATNLFVYSKNSFPHMMFATFLTLSFYLLKKYFSTNLKKYLIFAGMSYGLVSITYNGSFLLTVLPLIVYSILLKKSLSNFNKLISLLKDVFYFLIGLIPFIIVYFWFENARSGNQGNVNFYVTYAKQSLFNFPISVFIEGLWGQLLSPGRSIFVYSPPLLIILFFWHKIRKLFMPEVIIFLLMMSLYITFLATQVVWGDGGKLGVHGFTGLWHGESSWGPRYLTPIIPFGMLIVGIIFHKLSKFQRYLFFYPLVIAGLYIELLGIIIPYQIKIYNLERAFNVNETEFTSYVYTDLIPRYTPILSMSKNLIKLTTSFPKTLDHGIYNVKLYDGINVPFNVGAERWRVIEGKGYISFDNLKKEPIKKIAFGLINHPIKQSSSSAAIQFNLNGHPLLEKPAEFLPTERQIISIPINGQYLKEKGNELEINVVFKPPFEDISQIFAMISFSINNRVVNLESLDLPYYSSLGPPMTNAKYKTYGGTITDPWRFWDLHTQVYEKTPDFWWVKALYYWDYPQKVIVVIFVVTTGLTLLFGYKTLTLLKKLK